MNHGYFSKGYESMCDMEYVGNAMEYVWRFVWNFKSEIKGQYVIKNYRRGQHKILQKF